jgi:DNA-binding GntR family transcriptional regulator
VTASLLLGVDLGTRLSRSSGVPLYRQLSRLMADRLDEVVEPGTRLPTEAELAEQAGVNRLTVRQALAELAREGRIHTVQGVGSFAAVPPMRYTVRAGQEASFSRAMRAAGHDVEQRPLQADVGRWSEIARQLGARGRLLRLVQLRSVDGAPWSLTTTYLAHRRFPGLEEAWRADPSLYDLLERTHGVRMLRRRRRFSAVPARSTDAEHLDVPVGTPILLTEGPNVDRDGVPVSYVEHRFRGDLVRYEVDLP